MEPSKVASLVTGAIGCFLVVLASHPSLVRIVKTASSQHQRGDYDSPELYEDEDGTATEDTQLAFSDKLPKILVLAASTIGFLLSIALAVYGSVQPRHSLAVEGWVSFGIWVMKPVHRRGSRADSLTRSFYLPRLLVCS